MFPLMVFMFCFFVGMAVMLFYLLQNIRQLGRNMSRENAKLRALLLNMGGEQAAATRDIKPAHEKIADISHDPLLHLSFGEGEDAGELNLEPGGDQQCR